MSFLTYGVRHGKKEQEAAQRESLRDCQAALDSAKQRVTGYSAALKDLEHADSAAAAAARAAELALGDVRRQLREHTTEERRFGIPLASVPAWSFRRIELEALLQDLGAYANHVADAARDAAARAASMRRQLENAQVDVRTKTDELAELRERHKQF